MFYVYLVDKVKSQLYIGFSTNLRRRIKEHKTRWPNLKLLYYEAYYDEKKARVRENKLKMFGSAYRGLKRRLGM